MSLLALLAAHAASTPPPDPDPDPDPTPGGPVWIPTGTLTKWRTARDQSATRRVEVVVLGDSTTYGASSNISEEYGGWLRHVRDLSQADGFTDGGRGIGAFAETAQGSGEALAPVQSNSGFDIIGQAQHDFLSTSNRHSDATGETVTFQGYGSRARIYYRRQSNFGRFSYSVDGASAVTVDAQTPSGIIATGVLDLPLTGSGVHTITVTNLGRAAGDNGFVSPIVEWVKSTGIVYHKHAVSGAQWHHWFTPTGPHNSGRAALGLLQDQTTHAPAPRPPWRDPVLAMAALGYNDAPATGATEAQMVAAETLISNSCRTFIACAKAAGAEPVVIIPHLTVGPKEQPQRLIDALKAVAVEQRVPYVDFNHALAEAGVTPSNPHLSQAHYEIEGAYIWEHLLSV